MDWNNDGKKDLLVGDTDGFIWIFINEGTDAKPVLAVGRKLQVNGKDFKPQGGRAKPWVVDWNNDRKKDLIVGIENGRVLLLLNQGTDASPSFKEVEPLRVGAQDGWRDKLIHLFATSRSPKSGDNYLNGGMRTCPVVWDWNKDGKKDLLCADEFGKVTWFENVGLDAKPVFEEGIPVQARGAPISVQPGRSATADFAGSGHRDMVRFSTGGTLQIYRKTWVAVEVDGKPYTVKESKCKIAAVLWNDDKKADLLVGHEDGRILLFISQCDKEKCAFEKPIVLRDGDKPLQGGVCPLPSWVDWNKDGKKDLVCYSADKRVYWFENKGTDREPVFQGRQTVEQKFSPIYGGYRSRLEVVDWNSDGKPDLVYGVTDNETSKGSLYLFLAE